MNTEVTDIGEDQTLRQAGHRMRELGVTALPVRAADGSSQGIVSSDMIVSRIAAGGDPGSVTVGDLASAPETAPTGWALWPPAPQAA